MQLQIVPLRVQKICLALYMSNAVINNRDKNLSETNAIFAIRGVRY